MELKPRSIPIPSLSGPPSDGTTVTAGDTGHTSAPTGRRRRWWRGGLLTVLLVGACFYLFRVPILRSLADFLIIDQQGPADYVLILNGDGRYDRAASLYHSGSAPRILLVESRPKRLERMGFESSSISLTERELAARGVPRDAITVIAGQALNDWDRARQLRDWLESQPTVNVLVLCDLFGGRRLRYIFNEILGAEYVSRVRMNALPDRQFDETDWWHHRPAIVYLFDSYLRLVYDRLSGEDREEWREWDPEEYSKTLR
jgi:uncharacterized SAM-binding protein YcdF (DUF218 family)